LDELVPFLLPHALISALAESFQRNL